MDDAAGLLDLTTVPHERVLLLCRALAGCGAYVLHGSNVRPMLSQLLPRQANDRAKESGNQCAVYASINVEVVLMHALLNRAYLSARLGAWRVACLELAGRQQFRVSDNLYQLFRQRDPQLLSDGHVYALERRHFAPAADTATEFFALGPRTPHRILRVSAALGETLFRVGAEAEGATVFSYRRGELLQQHR